MSFPPDGLAEDRPLPVWVAVRGEGLSAQARGEVVIRSPAARRITDVQSAFLRQGESEGGTISASVIPTGYENGRYFALVQVAVPALSTESGKWEIGATLIRGGSAREIASKAIGTNVAGLPVVLEEVERFPAGPFEIVAVARDTSTNRVVSRRIAVTWPEKSGSAAIGPIAVLQPAKGAFVRGEETRTSGSLARSESDPLPSDRPTAIVGIVCRGSEDPAAIRVERRLIGEVVTVLPPIDLDLAEEPCSQVRDVFPANTLGTGSFAYEILLTADGAELARGKRTFLVVAAPVESPASRGIVKSTAP